VDAVIDVVVEIESAMTVTQRRSAYARFVGQHEEFRGAYWADILDHLVESGAHSMFVESLWDENLDALDPEVAPFYTPAILSLMYADGQPPTHDEVMALVEIAREACR